MWQELEKQLFAVLGAVTLRGEPRTVGIVYVARDRQLCIATGQDAWKTRHSEQTPRVSLTGPIARRVPCLPWLRIPAATITFRGEAAVHDVADVSPAILRALLRGVEVDPDATARIRIIRVRPTGEFPTYGIGVSLLAMREPEMAGGRAPV